MQEKYYTVEDISGMLGLHPKTIQRYVREGKLRASKLGKEWRISGHDLSLFLESNKNLAEKDDRLARSILVTAVADIDVIDMNEAMSIENTLTAALNSKPAEMGRSSMSVQFIEQEDKLRVMLMGSAQFMEAMMSFLSYYSKEREENYETKTDI